VKVQLKNNVETLIHTRFTAGGLCFLFFIIFSSSAFGQQNILDRVSAVERSDGKGFVIRYHLAQKVDSFRVYQPTADLVQMTLYSDSIDTTAIDLAETNEFYDEIRFYDIPFGIGIDIYLSRDKPFKAEGYPDGGSNDLLLGMTETSWKEINFFTEGLKPVIWSRRYAQADSLITTNSPSISNVSLNNDEYNKVKDKIKFDVVVIDPGHGGHDPGSIGYKGVKEKDIVLKIAKKVGGYIEEHLPDVNVVYTRDDDHLAGEEKNSTISTNESLIERGKIANQAEGDLFVSIHTNWFHSRQPHGTEVYFLGLERSESALEVMKRENNILNGDEEYNPDEILSPEKLLAYELQNSGYLAISEKIAGMIDYQFDERAQRRSRGVKQGRFVVLYHASMPAILVETGFISNPSEQRFLTSDWGQSIIASAIFRAIRNFKEEFEKNQKFNTANNHTN